ncbi:MAG: hypothetical protein HC844_07555 [Tabrizicola sp.]|nr:hypothetical protein [Tabrizicola sp.]
MSEIDDIQASYIAELRSVAPELRAWFSARIAEDGEDAVLLRWVTGLAGHPRVVEIFRRHYMRIEELNARLEREFLERDQEPGEGSWGEDETGKAPLFERHIDWLANDIKSVAPDVYDLVQGMNFVPVGTTGSGETV